MTLAIHSLRRVILIWKTCCIDIWVINFPFSTSQSAATRNRIGIRGEVQRDGQPLCDVVWRWSREPRTSLRILQHRQTVGSSSHVCLWEQRVWNGNERRKGGFQHRLLHERRLHSWNLGSCSFLVSWMNANCFFIAWFVEIEQAF